MNYGVDVDFGAGTVIENVDKNSYEETYEPRYIKILKLCKSALGLDLSKHSTGVSIWENNELHHFIIDVGCEDDNEDMRLAFKDALSELVKDKHFEIVCVEDVFAGINFIAVKELVTLNTVPDELIKEGVFTCDNLYRESNKAWKRWLRHYKKVEGVPTDKAEIRAILEYLEFPIESLERYNIGKKDRDQDILDSLGMILAVITREIMKISLDNSECKMGLKDMKIWHCASIEEYEACYNEGEDYVVIRIENKFSTSLIKEIRKYEGKMTLISEVSTDVLGRFASDYNIPLEDEYVCVVATPKTMSKPRKKKKKSVLIIR